MANPNRTDYEGPPLSGPGVLWINSKVTDPASLPLEAFHQWYEEIHIPDIIAAKPGGITASWRYRASDPDRSAPFLAVYKVPDMSFLQSNEFKSIPMVHPTLPGNGPIHRFADFDARFLAHVESWSSKDAGTERSSILISEAIEPTETITTRFDDWYRNTYITIISRLPGWRRTSRFQLVFKKENKDESGMAAKITPTLLALHEYQGSEVTSPQHTVEAIRQYIEDSRGKEIEVKQVDVASFELFRGFGETRGRWVESMEKRP